MVSFTGQANLISQPAADEKERSLQAAAMIDKGITN